MALLVRWRVVFGGSVSGSGRVGIFQVKKLGPSLVTHSKCFRRARGIGNGVESLGGIGLYVSGDGLAFAGVFRGKKLVECPSADGKSGLGRFHALLHILFFGWEQCIHLFPLLRKSGMAISIKP